MIKTMYHLRRINFQCYVLNNNNNIKTERNGVTSKDKVSFDEELNDGDEPSKNAIKAKSTYILLDAGTKIGRNPELVDVVLNSVFHSNMISRDHSEIFIEDGEYFIQDNSLNGTYINDYRAPKKPEKQRLNEGDIIKFGHVNGAAINPGEHAPQQSAEFIFKFEKALTGNHYFGYTEEGKRLKSGNTRAYMQIYSDRVTPQDSHASLGRVMLPQQTLTNGQQSATVNTLQQQQQIKQNQIINNQSGINLSVTIPTPTLQNNNQISPTIRTSTNITPLLIQPLASSSTLANTLILNNPASTIVANHQQQQFNNAFSAQQQNQLNAQQQQQLAAAVAAAAQNMTAAALSSDDMAAQLRQLMVANQDQTSVSALSSWLLPLSCLQSTNQLYGGGIPAAAAAAAAAFLNSNNSAAAAMLWPNVNQWRNTLQPNTPEWIQQQKTAFASYSSAVNNASKAAVLQQHLQTYTPQQQQNQQQQRKFVLNGNNCVVNNTGTIIAPTCLPSTSAMASSNQQKACNTSNIQQQLLPINLEAAIGNNSAISNSILSNNIPLNSAQNLALKQNFVSNFSASTSIITTPASLSLTNSYASILNASTVNGSTVVPLSSVYSLCNSSGIVGKTFPSQQELSATVSAAAAAQHQQKLKKDGTSSNWSFSAPTTSSCDGTNVVFSETSGKSVLPSSLISVLPAALRQGVSLSYMSGASNLPVNQRIPIATALAAAAAANNINGHSNKFNANEIQQFQANLNSNSNQSAFLPNKLNNTINISGNNEYNSNLFERNLIASPNLISSFGTPPPNTAQLLKDDRSQYSSTSLSTTSSLSSISALPSDSGSLPVSNRPTPLSSIKCETSVGSRTSTPLTCLLSPNSTASNKNNCINSLKDLNFKASLLNYTSNSMNSINSLTAKYFDFKPFFISTSTDDFSKKTLKNNDKIECLSELKDTSIIDVDSIKLEFANALVNGNNDCLKSDLKKLAEAAKIAEFDNTENGSSFCFSNLINLNAKTAISTVESVKTMECDSSVPSPPKINNQNLSISINDSLNLTEKSEIELQSPVISLPSRPCSYQSMPQSPPRAPCPRQQESPFESDVESRKSEIHKRSSSNDSRVVDEKNFVKKETEKEKSTNKQQLLNDSYDEKTDSDFDTKSCYKKKNKTLETSKPRNNIKRNEVERLLNDLTAGNCSWMYQASRNLNSFNKRNSEISASSYSKSSIDSKRRSLCLDDKKRREIEKRKLHKLMRQISDESSNDEEENKRENIRRAASVSSAQSNEKSESGESSQSSDDSETEELLTQKHNLSDSCIKKKNENSIKNSSKKTINKFINRKFSTNKRLSNEAIFSNFKTQENENCDKNDLKQLDKNVKKTAKKRKLNDVKKKQRKFVKNNSTDDDSDNVISDSSSDDEVVKRNSSKTALKKLKTINDKNLLKNNKYKKKKFKTSTSTIDEWHYHDPEQSICAHKFCCKPQDENVNWAACDFCDNWFHTLCALGSNIMLDDNADFNCGCKTGGLAVTSGSGLKLKKK